jgi:hypothetical protein
MVGRPVRRPQVAYTHQGGVSIRRACAPMHKAESLLPPVGMFHESHVHALCNVDRDPGTRRDRIDLASHRQCPPEVLVQPKDVVAGGGWLAFRMYYGPEFVSRAILKLLAEANINTAYIDPGPLFTFRLQSGMPLMS